MNNTAKQVNHLVKPRLDEFEAKVDKIKNEMTTQWRSHWAVDKQIKDVVKRTYWVAQHFENEIANLNVGLCAAPTSDATRAASDLRQDRESCIQRE